ncbi:MAG: hypothetical protein H6R27_954 [Proteobacteria bacterium]|nr:hypothetical protein [Pseudomonadota bacterium]
MNAIASVRGTAAAGRSGAGLAQRLARAGFWFFLVKGLLWLVAPTLAWLAV